MDVPSHLPSKFVHLRFILRRCKLLRLCDPDSHNADRAHYWCDSTPPRLLKHCAVLLPYIWLDEQRHDSLSPKLRLPKLPQLVKNNIERLM